MCALEGWKYELFLKLEILLDFIARDLNQLMSSSRQFKSQEYPIFTFANFAQPSLSITIEIAVKIYN